MFADWATSPRLVATPSRTCLVKTSLKIILKHILLTRVNLVYNEYQQNFKIINQMSHEKNFYYESSFILAYTFQNNKKKSFIVRNLRNKIA